MSIRKCFSVETDMTNPLTHAGPNLERGIEFAEDLCVQSFLQHATLFLSSFNTEFVSHAKWRAPDRPLRRPVNLQTRTRQPWSLKSSPNETALLPLEMKRATLPFWPYAPVSEEPTRCCEDLSCKSFKPRRIMPLIFGNRFPWEISQGISRQLCAFQLNSPARRCTYQGSGDRDVFP